MPSILERFLNAFKSGEIKEFVNAVTGDDIKNILVEINRQVRELGPEVDVIHRGDRMMVCECISPKREIQEKYFEKMAVFLRSVDSRKDMAIGMYYLINYLHLFSDGNGRTSRFVYEAITNTNFNDYSGKFFRHGKGESSSADGFDKQKNFADIMIAKRYSGYALYQYLTMMGLLPDSLKNTNLYMAKTYTDCVENARVYISEQALDEGILTSEVRTS